MSLKPVLNAIWMAPEMIIRGSSPKATSEVRHSLAKAMMIPEMSVERFWMRMETVVVVTVFTSWQSVDSRAVRVPALFLGMSNQGTGIFRIL